MNFDRSLLVLLVLAMVARLTHSPSYVCQTVCFVSALQAWRMHPKALRAGAATVSLD